MKLTAGDIGILGLIVRSPNIGRGWRQVSDIVWDGLICTFKRQELIELDEQRRRVRLSKRGKIVAEYIV